MKRIKLFPSGATVTCEEGDTVLVALERAGYALQNNCRAGACGECKVKVRSGQFDQGFVLDMALSPDERKLGYGLMCMAKPLSNELEIEWGTADARPRLFPPHDRQPMIVVDRIRRTPRIDEFVLKPVGEAMRFWPGQFVRIGSLEEGIPLRSYSIANAPRQDGEIRLQVSRVDGGRTSAWLHETGVVGTQLHVSGPYGCFIGDPSVDTPVLCLAAGSGLAPILSLTDAALRRGYRQAVTLMFSARTREDLYALGQMRYWETRFPNFRFVSTLTRDEVQGMLHGRLPTLLPQLFPDLSCHSVFISGSTDFVENCTRAAQQLGAKEDMLHCEGFYLQG